MVIKNIAKGLLDFAGLEYKFRRIYLRSTENRITVKYHKPVLNLVEGNNIISKGLSAGNNFLVARIGATELSVVLNYLHYRRSGRVVWSDYLKDEIWRQSGVFPADEMTLTKFAKEYLKAISEVDVMGVWNNNGENIVIKKYCPDSCLVPLESIEPYFFVNPWSRLLYNKKVLVIHPFEDSILYQYINNREKIFENKDVLPKFTILTLKAIQSQVYNKTNFDSWFDVFEDLKTKISHIDFDIAIIGAGAYGLPLASYIKKIGKKAIHMGGATQILFGIKGKRWVERDNFKKMFNEYWKYPFPHERPEKANTLEGGAYW